MATKGARKGARIGLYPLARIAAGIASLVPMYPSLRINIDAVANRGPAWAVAGICLVALSAAGLHEALEKSNTVAKRLLCGILAICFLTGSCGNAIVNISARSEDHREDKSSQIEQNQRRSEDRKRWSQARDDLAKVAGSATPESIEAGLQAAKARDANRWNSTGECDLSKITAGQSRTFCEAIGQLQSKLAAAKGRDDLEAKIAALDSKSTGKVVQSIDPFADSIAEAVKVLGYGEVSAAGKKRIATMWDWLQAILLEMIGSFGPVIAFSILMRIASPELQREPVKPSKVKVPEDSGKPEKPPAEPPAPVSDDNELDGFLARRIEFVQGSFIGSTPLYEAWKADCVESGVPCGTQKAFSLRVKRRVKHDPNNGRPRYAGIRFREKGAPRLKIVAK